MASEEGQLKFVERAESFLDTPESPTLIVQKTIRPSSFIVHQTKVDAEAVHQTTVNAEAVTSDSTHELARSVSTENQRAEVNVEVQGIRETCLSSSENVVTTRIRTVYSRSSSSGTPDANAEDHSDLFSSNNVTESDSAFTMESVEEGDVFEENGQRNRKTSDSYYIKQTYQISSSENTSLSVTAIQNVTFRSSKDVEIVGASSAETGVHSVERTEEVIIAGGGGAATIGSPREKQSHLEWLSPDGQVDQGLDKLKTARQDVQQLIQSSYMVSNIASVIDNDSMGPDSLRFVAQESSTNNIDAQGSSVDLQVSGENSAVCQPGDLSLKRETDDATQDRESPPRLTYSPGIAIRSYALEELSEKKSRGTPERIEAAVRSTRFDEESSQVDIDMGRSVDEAIPDDSIPHLKKVDFSKFKNRNVQSSGRDITTEDVNMFTLTKIQKVSLSDESESVTDNGKDSPAAQETNREEEDELLDQLVDLQSIQVGYRFHDVGMMLHESGGGICNMAFDDSDEADAAVQQTQVCLSLPSQTGSTVELTDGQWSSSLSTDSSSVLNQPCEPEVSRSVEASSSYVQVASASVSTQSTNTTSTIQGDTKLLLTEEFQNERVISEPRSTEDTSKIDVSDVLANKEVSAHDTALTDLTAASQEAEDVERTKTVSDAVVINANISPASSVTDLTAASQEAEDVERTKTVSDAVVINANISPASSVTDLTAASQEAEDVERTKTVSDAVVINANISPASSVTDLTAASQEAEDVERTKTVSDAVVINANISPASSVTDLTAASQEAEDVERAKTVSDAVVINANISPASSSYIESLTQVITAEIQQVVRSEVSSRQVSDKLEASQINVNTDVSLLDIESKDDNRVENQSIATESKEDYKVESQSIATESKEDYKVENQSIATESKEDNRVENQSIATESKEDNRVENQSIATESKEDYKVESQSIATESKEDYKVENQSIATESKEDNRVENQSIATESKENCKVANQAIATESKEDYKVENQSIATESKEDYKVENQSIATESKENYKVESQSIATESKEDYQVESQSIATESKEVYKVECQSVATESKKEYKVESQSIATESKEDYKVENQAIATESKEDHKVESVSIDSKSKEDYKVEIESNLTWELEHATSTVVSTQATVKRTEGHRSISSEITSGDSLKMTLSVTEQKQMSDISSAETTVSATETRVSSATSYESSLTVSKEALNQTSVIVEKAPSKESKVKVAKAIRRKAPLTITRKFNVNEKFESVLRSQGGVLKSESVFIDIYFDTPSFDLTLADCWLRTHNGRWQLHSNFSKLLNDGTKHEYFETEDTHVILATLELVLGAKHHQATADASVALFVVKSGLKEFARYRTKRKTYLLEELTVELDLPEYGFWVGSVTTTGNGYNRPCDAVNRIYSFWKKTGVDALNLLRD